MPKESLVGEKKRGFYYIMEALDYERIYYIGKLQRLLEEIVEITRERGKNKDPHIRKLLAELRTRMEVARLFALRIPWILDQRRRPTHEAAMLKVLYGEMEQDTISAGMKVLGLYGLKKSSKLAISDGELGRHLR